MEANSWPGTMGAVGTDPGPADDLSAVEGVTADSSADAGTAAAPVRPLGRLDDARCSVQALRRGDVVVATAAPAQRWVLIEQPGPWGRDALADSRFDAQVAPLLARRSRSENVRLLLVRRPGGRLSDSGRRWAYVDGRPGREG